MSIFSGIASAAHTFVSWLEKEFQKAASMAPTIEQMVEHACTYAVTILKVVLAQVEPGSETATKLQAVLGKVLSLSAVVYDIGAHATLADEVNVIVTDLNEILGLGGIKNANLVAGITKVVNTIAALVPAFLAIVPAA